MQCIRVIWSVFLTFMLLCVSAQPALATERGALFKVSLQGHTMYLFGTLHVGKSSFYPLEPRITEAVANASTLALEVDPTQPQQAMLKAVHEFGMLAQDGQGYGRLAPETRARMERMAWQAGVHPDRAFRYKPVLLATLLTLGEYKRQGYRIEHGADKFLARLARNGRTRLLELETVSSQLSMLDRLPEEDRWRFLDETVDTIASGIQGVEAKSMASAWERADRQQLDAIAQRLMSDNSTSGVFVREVMLKERNATLANKLMALLQRERNTVAAVGILHLLGEGSIPDLLAAHGADVERVY